MSYLFHTYLYQPLWNGLIYLYNTVAFGDLGVAIILLTIVIRLILYPFFYKTFKNQTIMQMIQPELKRIQHEHKDNKEKQMHAMMELYKTHKINPFSSIILLFIQLPVLIALYRVFLNGFEVSAMQELYGFVANPGTLNTMFLGLLNLKEKSIIIVILAAAIQYYQGLLSLPKTTAPTGEKEYNPAKTMVYMGPVLTLIVLMALPSAVGLYWLTSSLFSIGQQLYINKKLQPHGETSGNN